jgi:predicted permease
MPDGASSFWVILGALVPVFALVLVGMALRRLRILGGEDSTGLDRFVYFVALPAQLVVSVAGADIRGQFDGRALIAAIAAYVFGLVGAWWCSAHLGAEERGPLLNGAARPNGAFVGLPLVFLLAQGLPAAEGQELRTAYTVLLAGMVPCFSIGAVLAFTLPRHGPTAGGVLRSFAELTRNPIILGSLIGIILSLIKPGMLLGTMPGTMFDMLAAPAIPLALVLTGSHLDVATMRSRWLLLVAASTVKLLVLPALTWGLCLLLGVSGPGITAAVILMACPTAMAAVSMARILSADHELMAALIAASTVAAPFTLLGWLMALAPR